MTAPAPAPEVVPGKDPDSGVIPIPPEEPGDPSALAIVPSPAAAHAEAACTGSALSGGFRATGGVGPYMWKVTRAPSGVELREELGLEFELSGVPIEPGPLVVELRDGAGRVDSVELEVHERPRITTASLPAVCPGQLYAAPLAAVGGETEAYTWSAELLPGSGLPGALDGLGLAVRGAELSGHFRVPGGAAPLHIALGVADAHCASAPTTLPLDVLPAGTAQCPIIGISSTGASGNAQLPSACIGSPYGEQLALEGGTDGSIWETVSSPPGLGLDATHRLVGVPSGSGSLVVRVRTDERTVEAAFEMEARDKCWFAYVAEREGPGRLELVDARLLIHREEERVPSSAHRTFPSFPTDEAVTDFAFSPDGKWLAYRLSRDSEPQRLMLLSLLTWEEQPLLGSVTRYAWSPSSSDVAAVFQSEAGALVGGARLGGSGFEVVPALPVDETISAEVRRDLVWFAQDRVALLADHFLSDPSTGFLTLTPGYLELGAGSANFVLLDEPYAAGVQIRAGEGGFFVIDPYVRFYAPGRDRISHGVVIISPSGRFVGRARDGILRVVRAHQSAIANNPDEGAAIGGCTQLLAWAAGRERIACWSEEHARIMIYDLAEVDASRLALSEVGAVQGAYQYPPALVPPQRRAFSNSGAWFAFSTPGGVYVVQLPSSSPAEPPPPFSAERIPGSIPDLPEDRPLMLFSPDERFLLVHLATGELLSLGLDTGLLRPLSTELAAALPCSEDISDAATGWCGAAPISSQLGWSPNSDLVFARVASGALRIHDVSQQLSDPVDQLRIDETCAADCIRENMYRFQP